MELENKIIDLENKILQAIKDGELYGFIANNYYEISKEKLKDIILEMYFLITTEYKKDVDEKELNDKLIKSLKEYRNFGI